MTDIASEAGKAWFTHDRFGLFLHFGIYAQAARHEWVKNFEEMSDAAYDRYFDHFDPDLYEPREWARMAREAGMKYVVLTAKHHDGFCLWDSKFTQYKATNTPYGKDLLRPYAEAFRAEGLRVGFYYSLLDWHHPDFAIDFYHPQRNHPDAAALNAGRDIRRYAQYMRDQVTELLTGFGQIDVIWFDFSYPDREHRGMPGKGRVQWESEALIALVRKLQPNIIVSDRLDLVRTAENPPELLTPEQLQPNVAPTFLGKPVRWEACHTMSGSWGYHRDETSWKDAGQLINLLVDTVALGGNLLMNVGPTARGTFDKRAQAALATYGQWLHLNGRAIYGAGASAFKPPNGGKFTQRGNRLYLHVQSWPYRHIHIEGLGGRVKYAQLLHDASEVRMHEPVHGPASNMDVHIAEGSLVLELPVIKPEIVVPVIELFLKD